MVRSEIYTIWKNDYKNYVTNIENFIKENRKITEFTKEEIKILLDMNIYSYLFANKIVKNQLEILYRMLEEHEYLEMLEEGHYLKEEMFQLLIKHYDERKNMLIKLKDNCYWYNYFEKYFEEFVEQKIMRNEKDFFEFLPWSRRWNILLEKQEEPYYKMVTKDFLQKKENIEEAFKNLNYVYFTNLFHALKILKQSPYFEEVFEKNKQTFYKTWLKLEKITKENEDLFQTIILIIEDGLKLAKKNITDIEYFRSGSICKTYKVGDFVIKVGKKWFQEKIPNDEALLYPVCRKYIRELDIAIIISYYGETENLYNEDAYQLFKEIRNRGNNWIDVKKENIVRLLQDNNSYGFEVEPETIGFVGKTKEKKKKGEIVICDLEALYKEDEVPWATIEDTFNSVILDEHKMYESRYQRERKLTGMK